MANEKTHYKKLMNPDYIGAYSLMVGDTSPDLNVTITSVKRELVTGADGKKEECTVAYLKDQKPFILNSTNGKTLSKLFDTPYIEEWEGKSFKLVVKTIRAFGENVDALRVKNERVAKQLPTLTIGSKTFNACRERYLADKSVLDKIKQSYTLTPEVEKALTDESV